MAGGSEPLELLSPWKKFLEELDSLLKEPFAFHCIGGFAVVAAYHLPRSTNDLDYFTLQPADKIAEIQEIAGERSALARKHKVHVHHAGIASLPESYEQRMWELFPGRFKRLHLLVLDPYDLVLSKLSRNAERDREDAQFLSRTLKLDGDILRRRYEAELTVNLIGPRERHDSTLRFWLEAYFAKSQ
jgi:Nucleotidyltransferase of unknown function (DUF6036)